MAQKAAGGNPSAITSKGGDGASGSTGTGRGGGNNARGSNTTAKKSPSRSSRKERGQARE